AAAAPRRQLSRALRAPGGGPMSGARERVLAAVRRAVAHEVPHPGPHPAPALDASWDAFAARLTAVGGEAHGPFAPDALRAAVLALAARWSGGGRIAAEASAAAALGDPPGLEVLPPGAPPHGLADVAVAIARGALGVAESGAVAVLGRDTPNRALLFLAERVILLLDAPCLVGDLHSAVRALPLDALAAHHVTWISGPSKT